jgi:hypothetical protein
MAKTSRNGHHAIEFFSTVSTEKLRLTFCNFDLSVGAGWLGLWFILGDGLTEKGNVDTLAF